MRMGLDCHTFWRSNPKRINQFADEDGYAQDADLRAWATGYYVSLAFAGKMPNKPDLLSKPARELTVEETADEFAAWAAKVNSALRGDTDGRS